MSSARRRVDLFGHHEVNTRQNIAQNQKLDSINTQLASSHTQQDGIIGAINNTTIGDGTLGQRTYVYAHDVSNGQAKALKCDANGRFEC